MEHAYVKTKNSLTEYLQNGQVNSKTEKAMSDEWVKTKHFDGENS